MPKFLSEEWIEKYAQKWNENDFLKENLRKFNASIKYFIDGSEQQPVYIKVEEGKVIEYGVANGEKYDFEMWATPDDWKILATGQMGPKAAMLTKKLKFKGSMVTAMKYMSPFEESLRMMSEVPTEW